MKNLLYLVLAILFSNIIEAKDITSTIEKLIEKGKLEQAENAIYQAQAEGEFSPALQIYLARIFFLKKNIKNAYETLMGIEDPADFKTRAKLLSFLLEFGDTALSLRYNDMATNILYKIYKLDPDYPLGPRSRLIALSQMEQGNYEEAKKLFEKFLAEGGNFDDIAQNYIKCLYLLSQWNEIMNNSTKILKYKEDAELQFILGESYFNMARIYLDNSMYDSALVNFNKFIQWGIPKIYLDDAYYYKGLILETLQDFKGALECYYKVLALAPPRSIYARKSRERISELEKK